MWAIFAVLASVMTSIYLFANQNVKTNPKIFMMYRGFVPLLIMLPFVPFVELITDWRFYFFCTLQGCVVSYSDYKLYRATRTWGAEISSSIKPFAIGIVFVLWLVISPSTIFAYANHPIKALLVVASLGAVIYSVSSFTKSKKSSKALKYMAPYLCASGAIDVINKLAMSHTEGKPETGVMFYIMILGVVIGTVNLIRYLKEGNGLKGVFGKNTGKLLFVGVMAILPQIFKNLGMYSTPNPAYITAVINLYIVWIMLTNIGLKKFGIIRHYRKMDKLKVLVLLASVIVLILVKI